MGRKESYALETAMVTRAFSVHWPKARCSFLVLGLPWPLSMPTPSHRSNKIENTAIDHKQSALKAPLLALGCLPSSLLPGKRLVRLFRRKRSNDTGMCGWRVGPTALLILPKFLDQAGRMALGSGVVI